jgi:peptide/nickel transport system permease protein
MGYSFIHGTPVLTEIGRRYPITLQLTAMSMLIALGLGVPLGVLSARKRGTLTDFFGRLFALIGISTPNFFVGTLIVVLGALYFPKIPTMGYVSFTENPLQSVTRMFWPAFSLGIAIAAILLRYTRSSVLEVLGEDYIRTARAKGLADRTLLLVHALKNALIPVIMTPV